MFAWPDSPTAADDSVLTPCPVSRTRKRESRVRSALFRSLDDTVQQWLDLPCANAAPNSRVGLGTVRQAVQNIQEAFGVEIEITNICFIVYTPILLCVLHGQWETLASALDNKRLVRRRIERDGATLSTDQRVCSELYSRLDLALEPNPIIGVFQDEPKQKVLREIATLCRRWWPFIKKACQEEAVYQEVFANEVCQWLCDTADQIEFPFADGSIEHDANLRRGEYTAVTLVRYLALSAMVLSNSELPALLRRTLETFLCVIQALQNLSVGARNSKRFVGFKLCKQSRNNIKQGRTKPRFHR